MALNGRRALRFHRSPGDGPLVLGHRGARHASAENTLAAFELARREGAAGVELDVRITSDDELIVLHDPNLERVTAGRTLAEAEALPAAAVCRLDVGGGERVPRLADVLDWAEQHDLCLNIEIKADVRRRRALLHAVARTLRTVDGARERLLLSSFHPGFVVWLARALPDLGVCWLVHARQRLLRSAPAFERLGAIGVNPEHTLLSVESVRRWKRAGHLVCTWTVNDPKLAVAYATFGVDAIISDYPGRIRAALESRSS
jgi:glycerophosphoryl diester phosphodiesterase